MMTETPRKKALSHICQVSPTCSFKLWELLVWHTFDTYSKLPGTKPPFKDSEVVDEQAATEGIFYVQTNQPAPQEPPHLQMGYHKFSF